MDALAVWARRGLHGTAIGLFVLLVVLVLAQVVARKLFEPLVWSEELARYVFIWVALLGWVIASRRRSHVAMGLLAERLPPAARAGLSMLADGVTLAVAGVLLRQGVQLVVNNRDVETVTLFFGMGVVYAALPFAALCLLADTVLHARERWRAAAAPRLETQELPL